MVRAVTFYFVATFLWALSPGAQAIPLAPQEPPIGLSFSPGNWKDSDVLSRTVEMLGQGEREKAKAELAKFLRVHPNDPRGLELAGMILLEEKDYSAATVSFERALALNPKNAGAGSKLGISLLLQGKKAQGEDALNKSIRLNPGEPLARRYLGWLEEGRNNTDAASRHYLAAMEGGDLPSGTLTELHLALGRIYGATGRHAQNIRMLEPLAGRASTGAIGLAGQYQLALAYLELKRNTEAIDLIRNLEKHTRNQDRPELAFLKAFAQLDSNPGISRQKLQALAKSHPEYANRSRFLVARSYAAEGKTTLAIKELETLADAVEGRDLLSVLTALAGAYLADGKPAELGRALETYIKRNPGMTEITYLGAEAWYQAGAVEKSKTLLAQLVTKKTNNAKVYALLGQIERDRAALPVAEEHLKKAMTLDNSIVSTWINLAGIYVSRGDMAKAEGYLKQGLAVNVDNSLLHFELANIYDATGREQDANALYRKILATNPNYLPALNNIALNLAEGNDLGGARQYAEKAYLIEKSSPVVQDTYGWILVLSNDIDRGLPLLNGAAQALPTDATVSYHLGAALIKAGKTDEGKRHLKRALTADLPEKLRRKAQILMN